MTSKPSGIWVVLLGVVLAAAGLLVGAFIALITSCTDGYGRHSETLICEPGWRQGLVAIEWILCAACLGPVFGAIKTERTGNYSWIVLGVVAAVFAIGLLLLLTTGQLSTQQ